MRKNQIELGKVFAYQSGTYAHPEPLVFLSKDLYASQYNGRNTRDPYTRAEHDTRPSAGWAATRTVGYPVLICDHRKATPETIALMLGTKPEIVTSAEQPVFQGTGIRFTLLTRMAAVIGDYHEVMKARAEQDERARRRIAARIAETNRLQLQRDDLTARLEVLGIECLRHDDRLSFTLDEVAKIVGRLEKLAALDQDGHLLTVFSENFPGAVQAKDRIIESRKD